MKIQIKFQCYSSNFERNRVFDTLEAARVEAKLYSSMKTFYCVGINALVYVDEKEDFATATQSIETWIGGKFFDDEE